MSASDNKIGTSASIMWIKKVNKMFLIGKSMRASPRDVVLLTPNILETKMDWKENNATTFNELIIIQQLEGSEEDERRQDSKPSQGWRKV